MNERIQQLADEAKRYALETYPSPYEPYANLYDKKFAELIVMECVKQALEEKVSEEEIDKEDDIEDRCYLRGNNGGIVDAVIRIKQHFGVEE